VGKAKARLSTSSIVKKKINKNNSEKNKTKKRKYVKNDNFEKKEKQIKTIKKHVGKAKARLSTSSILKK
jgi:hypothetical protein